MTKSEYFEKNGISFAKAMEIFNDQKNKKGGTKSFDKFLASEHVEYKFKAGDLIVLQVNPLLRTCGWCNNVVFEVMAVFNNADYPYQLKALTPNMSEWYSKPIGYVDNYMKEFVEDNCVLY